MIVLTLSGQNPSRYYITCDDDVIGRRYDNIAEAFSINKPVNETGSVCTMFATYKGRFIDSIIVEDSTIEIKNNISQFEYIDISFMFTRPDGYVKNSEIKRFYFEEALKPTSFTPTEPQSLDALNQLIAKAFVTASYDNNMLVMKNLVGDTVFEAQIFNTPDLWTATNYSFEYTNDSATIKIEETNLRSLQTRLATLLMKLADETNAGLMSPATVKAISDLISRVDSLEARSVRLLYTESENPTAEDIENFVKAQGYSYPYSGIAVVVDKTFHVWYAYTDVKNGFIIRATKGNTVGTAIIPWSEYEEFDQYIGDVTTTNNVSLNCELQTYFDADINELILIGTINGVSLKNNFPDEMCIIPGSILLETEQAYSLYSVGFGAKWQDDGQDTASQFTNDVAGIIKGSNIDGKVYAEDDGTGSVKGWDELKTLVQTLLTNLNNKLDKVTGGGSGRAYCVSSSGQQVMRQYSGYLYGPVSLLYRENDGDCCMQDPISDYSIANKRYVDRKAAGRNNVIIVDDTPVEGMTSKTVACKRGNDYFVSLSDSSVNVEFQITPSNYQAGDELNIYCSSSHGRTLTISGLDDSMTYQQKQLSEAISLFNAAQSITPQKIHVKIVFLTNYNYCIEYSSNVATT